MVAGQLIDPSGKPLVSQAKAQRLSDLTAAYEAASNSAAIAKHFESASAISARDANDAETRKILRSRSRWELNQNNSFGVGIVRTLVNDVLGRGPRLQVNDPRLTSTQKEQIERRFKRWAIASRLTSCLRTSLHGEIVDGESFLHESTNQRQEDDCKLAVKLTETDQISSGWTTDDDEYNIDGVHIDEAGYPVWYERLRVHPYDTINAGAAVKHKSLSERIDSRSMAHLFRCERPGQYRGIPWMVSALPLFALLRRYTLAVVMCAESAARQHGVLYTDHPTLEDVDPIAAMDQIELELGMWTTMPEGWKLGQLKAEQPTQVYAIFRDAILCEVARCVSMPCNKALGNSGGWNYASGMLDFQTYYEMIQVERFRIETEAIDRIFQWWFDEAVLISGYLPDLGPLPGGIDHVWMWDEFKHVDPTKEANATETLWQIGLKSDAEYLLSKGIDPEEHYARMTEQAKRRKEAGMPMPGGSTPTESLERRAKQDAADKAEEKEEAAA